MVTIGHRTAVLTRTAIRYPSIHIIRLSSVAAFSVVGSIIAAVGARLVVGTVQNPLDPENYGNAWWAACVAAAFWWVRVQWRERPLLPRRRPLGLALSPTVGVLVVLLLLLPSHAARFAADHYVRGLRSKAEVMNDAMHFDRASLDWCYLGGTVGRATIAPYAGDILSRIPKDFFGSDKPNDQSEPCRLVRAARATAYRNIAILLQAQGQGLGGNFPTSVDPSTLFSSTFLAMMIGSVAAAAAVVPWRILLPIGMLLEAVNRALMISRPRGRDMMGSRVDLWSSWADICRWGFWAMYLTLFIVMAIGCLGRHRQSRTIFRDCMVVLLLLWPPFAIAIDLAMNERRDLIFSRTFGSWSTLVARQLWYPGLVMIAFLGAGLALGALISRYRASPSRL